MFILVNTHTTLQHSLYCDDGICYSFTDGGAPPDGTPNQIRHTFMIGLVVWFDILAASGILFTVACLVFNIVFRNRR